ncbi:MAG: toxic anion resistance protein [Zymomonas mobilis subsp. pomaceae]|uniref:Toxic anion resistance family protein n=1 Tax=Zymomonas mobilis subsp. pomaceae (strain ATCC 29192 / DSM 22645 / JCM 10191 / CCUG 17912 / NBRC 13757 / NCIMB 11200 / NRRL B-4491 / Barker I) TaxID=579138 RepID=F8ERV5_ZYMMT|nr:toxic anion resistance protein [Zymomonas mobilis]AEI38568.1 toxic anion resistance family protein [Zymomonas mobilis subsp. pomaceae ATCC 29192]MDX5948258.1 toxic anion resistance protein [Zymomonas mobilis subsp. pomaceae]GEB89013.1 toxic anion resistance protein [Zymomonas mobilis subsp. pomaceae]
MTAENGATTNGQEGDLKLTPPTPVPNVAPEKADGLVPLKDEQKSQLEAKVSGFIEDLVAQNPNSPEFGKRVDSIINLGRNEIRVAATQSNRFLDRPVKAMDGDGHVGTDLAQLRRVIEDLDPARQGNLTAPKKLFGILPFGNKLRDYFDSYKSAQSHISTILARLESGKDELLKDNAAIDVERQTLWASLERLEQMIYMAKTLDTQLEAKAHDLDISDPAKAKTIRESALFYVRQRVTDLLTQLAVSVQGYLALDLVRKNNIELIKGVDRASTTTVAALRTAVTVAQALTNQKLVLEQINALNTTTANIIDATGEMLKNQTGEIQKQAASATIPLDTLKRAFSNIYATMDSIDQYKVQALSSMKQTVDALTDEVEKSRGYIARAQGASNAQSQTNAQLTDRIKPIDSGVPASTSNPVSSDPFKPV